MSAEHEHEFDGPPTKGLVRFCVDRKCTERRIGTGKAWRELTTAEHTTVTIAQMEDLVYVQVAQIIHGDHWRDWFEKVRGHR